MTSFVALLRAVNVGGRQLKMSDLKAIAGGLGLGSPRTYIASGNLLFSSGLPEQELKPRLEDALQRHMGKPVAVMVRTAEEMAGAVERNPFSDQPGNRVIAIFFDLAPEPDAAARATHVVDERLALGAREIYVHYPNGMGGSKLKIPDVGAGTARNMNTVAKLAELAKEMA